ncbi:MAG: cobalamin B12-binding domain-containing protein [Anaerolineae bacterium]|nr:cobalamin B12-binding domain-containing protein [Anaerolineae bacterium]
MNDHESDGALISRLVNLDEKGVLALVSQQLRQGEDPLRIIEECQEGMRQVGLRYEQRKYFLSGLMMAGEIFREVMELVEPVLVERLSGNESGHILLGTVQGDIHDIGKNIFGILLRCHGFTVTDLGVDVPPAYFLEQARQLQPDIIGLSGLLTTSYDVMRETVDLLRRSGDVLLARKPIIIGGGILNAQVCAYVGADYWAIDAMVGVDLCKEIMTKLALAP